MDAKVFVANYEKILKERHITKGELYENCGFSSSAVSQWKSGATSPSWQTVENVASYLNVPVSLLIEEEHAPLVNDDPELTAYLEELRTRPEMRMLFSVTHGATKEDVEKAVKIIEALREKLC